MGAILLGAVALEEGVYPDVSHSCYHCQIESSIVPALNINIDVVGREDHAL